MFHSHPKVGLYPDKPSLPDIQQKNRERMEKPHLRFWLLTDPKSYNANKKVDKTEYTKAIKN